MADDGSDSDSDSIDWAETRQGGFQLVCAGRRGARALHCPLPLIDGDITEHHLKTTIYEFWFEIQIKIET